MTDFVISYRLPLRRQVGMLRTFRKNCAVGNDNFFAATKIAVDTEPLIHLPVEWHETPAWFCPVANRTPLTEIMFFNQLAVGME